MGSTIGGVSPLVPPDVGDVWFGLSPEPLPHAVVSSWIVLPSCGASVVFTGTARDHATDRPDVTALEYEAYEEQVLPRFEAIAGAAREQWPALGRIAILHRTGPVALMESAVVIGVSSPHRAEAFEAARWCIDSLKQTVPVWKRETWSGGTAWGLDGSDVRSVADVVPVGGRIPDGVVA